MPMTPSAWIRWLVERRWTLGIGLFLAILNIGLLPGAPEFSQQLLLSLEYRRSAVLQGEVWRLITGSLVHTNLPHFAWDVSAFLIVGMIYEPALRRVYPWLLLTLATAVNVIVFLFLLDVKGARGLSGVDYGLLVAGLCTEWPRVRRSGWAALAVGGTAALLIVNVVHECLTGQMIFGSERLADVDSLLWSAHPTGMGTALVFMLVWHVVRSPEPVEHTTAPEQSAEVAPERTPCQPLSAAGEARRPGVSLLELLVVIAIIMTLMMLLLPAFGVIHQRALRTQCGNNLRQLGLALHQYNGDHGIFPNEDDWDKDNG